MQNKSTKAPAPQGLFYGDDMRSLYLCLAIVGAVLPWLFFADWFGANGISPAGFIFAAFSNSVASAFTADVVISSIAFLIWSFFDARQLAIRKWWLVLPANLLVGLSLALPLYLWLREGKKVQPSAA